MSIQSIAAGTAFVKLTLDNAELKRGLDDAQGKVQNFAASVKSLSSQIVLFGPLLATPRQAILVKCSIRDFCKF